MKLSQIKNVLNTIETVNFQLPNGSFVPEHFHVTEVGLITKNFIDCGGTIRKETVANFQLLDANDFDHRLKPHKLLKIIELSEKALGIGDFEIEVEYQTETIGKYSLGFDDENFTLNAKSTACLAKDNCGIKEVAVTEKNACCTTNSHCC